MGENSDRVSELLAELDIELVSALYRAASEPDALDNLVATLEERYRPKSPAESGELRDAVTKQLGQIATIIDDQDPGMSRDPLERAVEEVPTAAIVIDPFGKVVLTNELGARVLAARPDQGFDFDLIDPGYRTQFRDFIASARLRGNQRRIIVRLDMNRDEDESAAPIELAEAMIVESARRDHGCIALRALEIPWTKTVDAQMQEAFGLTRAECEISRQFYELRDTRAVAADRGTTLATVQTQLKSVFAKTQTANQAQLLQVLSLLCARANLDKKSRLVRWSNPLGREATFTRSDGREIAYSWQGAEDGKPVLVVHGHTLGHMFPPEAERIYREAGLKLYIISRPGFGHSQYDPKIDAVADSTSAILDFCDYLGLIEMPAITVSTGLVSLASACKQRADLVRAVASLGYIYFPDVPLDQDIRRYQRMVFKVAHRSPPLFRAFSRIAYRNMQRVGVDWYIDRLLGEDAIDRPFFRSGANAGLIRAATHHVLTQGPEVYAREHSITREPILRMLERDPFPALFLVPDHDRVHPFEDFRRNLSVSERTSFVELPGTGEIYFYKAAEEIARQVVRHFDKAIPGYVKQTPERAMF